MHLVIVTFILLFLLRWLAAWLLRSKEGSATGIRGGLSLGLKSIKMEALAWLIAFGAIGVLFLLALAGSYFFGGIPPIHEWGS
jgi:hypothetical protein